MCMFSFKINVPFSFQCPSRPIPVLEGPSLPLAIPATVPSSWLALRSKGHHHQPAAHCRGLRSLTHQKSRRQPSRSLAELRRAPAGAERKRASTPAGLAHSLPRTPPEGAVWPDEVAARRPQAMPGPMACHTHLPPQPAQRPSPGSVASPTTGVWSGCRVAVGWDAVPPCSRA